MFGSVSRERMMLSLRLMFGFDVSLRLVLAEIRLRFVEGLIWSMRWSRSCI